MTSRAHHVLHIDASARSTGSATRNLSARLVANIRAKSGAVEVKRRDLAAGVPFVDETFVAAINTPPEKRTAAQKKSLEVSDALVAELQWADTVVIGVPVYNFAVPAAFKAWIDQVARAGVTFRYTENGPIGLLEGKKAYVAMASGGTKFGSEIDFASGWVRHILGFIGIGDVEFVGAGQIMMDGEAVARAEDEADRVAA